MFAWIKQHLESYANWGVAKINLFISNGNTKPTEEQTAGACSDLKHAYQLGDKSVKNMIASIK